VEKGGDGVMEASRVGVWRGHGEAGVDALAGYIWISRD
jgi:hypothetical protein